jgi:hypothetical protein
MTTSDGRNGMCVKNRDGPQDVLTVNRCILGQLMVDW